MTTLTEFLLARIAEDEAVAKAAIDPDRPGTHWQWVRQDDRVVEVPSFDDMPVYLGTVEEFPTSSGVGDLPAFALNFVEVDDSRALPHIARHDPARVLAECAAKRQIVELAAEVFKGDGPIREGSNLEGQAWAYERTLRALATSYADHPDYRAEWVL